jgi:hypothetical protein
MQMLFWMYIVFGLLQISISLPLIREKVKPNPWYGFRIKATLENPRIWYAINKHFGQRLLVTAVGFLIGAVGLYFVPGINTDGYALICLGIFVVFFMIGMGQSLSYLKALTKKSPN